MCVECTSKVQCVWDGVYNQLRGGICYSIHNYNYIHIHMYTHTHTHTHTHTGSQNDFSDTEEVQSVASLLKLYFRELPEPLIPYSMYDVFCKATERKSSTILHVCPPPPYFMHAPPPYFMYAPHHTSCMPPTILHVCPPPYFMYAPHHTSCIPPTILHVSPHHTSCMPPTILHVCPPPYFMYAPHHTSCTVVYAPPYFMYSCVCPPPYFMHAPHHTSCMPPTILHVCPPPYFMYAPHHNSCMPPTIFMHVLHNVGLSRPYMSIVDMANLPLHILVELFSKTHHQL